MGSISHWFIWKGENCVKDALSAVHEVLANTQNEENGLKIRLVRIDNFQNITSEQKKFYYSIVTDTIILIGLSEIRFGL